MGGRRGVGTVPMELLAVGAVISVGHVVYLVWYVLIW